MSLDLGDQAALLLQLQPPAAPAATPNYSHSDRSEVARSYKTFFVEVNNDEQNTPTSMTS